ncbi:hypothetical protein ACFFSW_27305 [Saccharothrix longispora]|uniref:DUF397 domain-containing protein n=1 Tax=Saccharothrix longispora TaxID=33920 RepID=A0ABU1Q0M6_9PSEU|nr:hypothetical protein [Saccharothrix longispora]MDR6596435.1 hypothetical protein [Saccharothrix longispora]
MEWQVPCADEVNESAECLIAVARDTVEVWAPGGGAIKLTGAEVDRFGAALLAAGAVAARSARSA